MVDMKLLNEIELEFGSIVKAPKDDPRVLEIQRKSKGIMNSNQRVQIMKLDRESVKKRNEIILNLYARGFGQDYISQQTNISTDFVRTKAKKSGLEVNKRFFYKMTINGEQVIYFIHHIEAKKFAENNCIPDECIEVESITPQMIYRGNIEEDEMYYTVEKGLRQGETDKNIEFNYELTSKLENNSNN